MQRVSQQPIRLPRLALTVAVLVSPCALGACGADSRSAEFTYQNQLFQHTTSLPVAQSGPTSQPNFSWPATGVIHVVCAIFSERISVLQDQIQNQDRVVWIWHSGLGRGREGNVLYAQGVADPTTLAAPRPLEPERTYYWAVWAFEDDGMPEASSFEQTLTVLP